MNYHNFINTKKQSENNYGFDPLWMPDFLFGFQAHLDEWAIKKGRAAIFADTGLGKTIMELVFAQNIIQKTNKNVIILAPLAVSSQIVEEAKKFGIDDICKSRDGSVKSKITVTNYQQLHKFNHNDFTCLVCDESSILKNFGGQLKTEIIRFCSKMPYRLLSTATPSPNDFVELGNSSEALGNMKYMDMIHDYFRDTSNDKNPQWSTPKYVLMNHGVNKFWRWVCSWARACRMPSDLGFPDDTHVLHKLIENEHVIMCSEPAPGRLFVEQARTLREQREERKRTVKQRCEKVLERVENHDCSVIWCHYNYESDYLKKMIPESVEVSGQDSDEKKEEKFEMFTSGKIRRLITKPKIGCLGLNWQHCAHATFFTSHSFEQYYQGCRRLHRYGQKRDVIIDNITTEGEGRVSQNIKRKASEAKKMFQVLVDCMNDELKYQGKSEIFNQKMEVPKW